VAKRNIISEISEIHNRSANVTGVSPPHRLSDLEWSLKTIRSQRTNSELLKYIPIGAVACIEGYFRRIIANLIDRGGPYAENAMGFEDVLRGSLDLRGLLAVQQDTLSAGEFIAHLLPISSLEDIGGHMGVLLNAGFLNSLRGHITLNPVASPAKSEEVAGDPERQADLAGLVFATVKESFRQRHIFCHESDSAVSMDVAAAERVIEHTKLFLLGTARMVRDPNDPFAEDGATTVSINDALIAKHEKLEFQLEETLQKLQAAEASGEEEAKELLKVQDEWKRFRDSQCAFRYNQYRDGSIRNSLCVLEAIRLTKIRIADLDRAYYEWAMGDRAQNLPPRASWRRN
jgi:uncharacterized protein YecT (DUF1311 family)